MQLPGSVQIKENSGWARIAAWYMGSKAVAMVWGQTIHLWGADRASFLSNRRWLQHELKHVEQFARMGKWAFVWAYLAEWCRHGYRANKFEIEAREAERN
jgi:hypothetical protein